MNEDFDKAYHEAFRTPVVDVGKMQKRIAKLEAVLRELTDALVGARNLFSRFEDKNAARERLDNAEAAARAALTETRTP